MMNRLKMQADNLTSQDESAIHKDMIMNNIMAANQSHIPTVFRGVTRIYNIIYIYEQFDKPLPEWFQKKYLS